MDSEALMRKILAGDLHYAKLWLICVVLRGASWDKMSFEQRELAFQAKNAATDVLNTFLGSSAYRYANITVARRSLITPAIQELRYAMRCMTALSQQLLPVSSCLRWRVYSAVRWTS